MPPRGSRRGGAAKKPSPSPRAKAAGTRASAKKGAASPSVVSVPEEEVSPNVIEETQILESVVPLTVVVEDEGTKQVPSTASANQGTLVEQMGISQVEEVAITTLQVKDDDSSTKIGEGLMGNEEASRADEGLMKNEGEKDEMEADEEQPDAYEEKRFPTEEVEVTTMVVEETTTTTVTEEIVQEKNQEVAALEVGMEEKATTDEGNEEVEPEEDEGNVETMELDPDAEEDIEEEPEEDIEEEIAEDAPGTGNVDDTTDVNEGGNREEEGGESGSDDEENEDPSAYMPPLSDRKKQKEFEIFVGGLDKGAVEEDLIKVFKDFGDIKSVRIVKHPTTQKSKGFAFIRYATVEEAKKALAELKDGTEVKGKHVGISPSQDSDTLYTGNICKTWNKDQVLETLKSIGVEQIEEIYLPDDPKSEGKNRGFALLEFSSHSDAMSAFQRLRKPDAVFGCDRSAKVAFAQSSIHPSEEALSQVKTVFVEGLTISWDEEKLKDFCKQYGEIEKIQLSRKLTTTKRKDFGFVTFTLRESAVACVEGINNAEMAEGDIKVKANLAKPQYKGRLGKQAARGGYRVKTDGTEEAGPSKMQGQAKSNESEGKGKSVSKLGSAKGQKPFKPQYRGGERHGPGGPSRSDRTDRQRTEQPVRGSKRGGRSMDRGFHEQPSKKPRGGMRGRPSNNFGNRRPNPRYDNVRQNYGVPPITYVDPYAQAYAAPAASYASHSYGAHSGSKRSYSDMEPHAGYIDPSPAKQGRVPYGYDPRRPVGYGGRGSSGTSYAGSALPPSYAPVPPPAPSSYAGYEARGRGYGYPSNGAYPPPRSGYY